jgi:hypothetical protein
MVVVHKLVFIMQVLQVVQVAVERLMEVLEIKQVALEHLVKVMQVVQEATVVAAVEVAEQVQ